MQPSVVESKMRKHIELTDKYQNRLWTRILLERLLKITVGTNYIQNHAIRQIRNMNVKHVNMKFKGIIHDNMRYKLGDAKENESDMKEQMTQANIELKKSVRKTSISGYENPRINTERTMRINYYYNKSVN